MNKIALVDLDLVLCDHDKALQRDLKDITGVDEEPANVRKWKRNGRAPDYIFRRMQMIRSKSEWWATLPPIPSGLKLYHAMRVLGYDVMIATQVPSHLPAAWDGKVQWVRNHLGVDTDITITSNKSLINGSLLFDDSVRYQQAWLSTRPEGLGIMLENEFNRNCRHPQLIHYNGGNFDEVYQILEERIENE